MSNPQSSDPLHGITLKAIVQDLVDRHGWEELGDRIHIRCFQLEPSLNSSLKFLRKTPWARTEVEQLYIADQLRIESNRKRNQRRASMRKDREEPESEPEPEPE